MPNNSTPTEEVANSAKKVVKKTIGTVFKFLLFIIVSIALLLILLVSSLRIIYQADTADQLYNSVNDAKAED